MGDRTVAVLSCHTPSLFWFRLDMMREFISRGWHVVAVGNEAEEQWSARFREEGIVYRQIEAERNGANPLKDIKTLLSVRRVLREVRPQKIFCFQAKTVIYGAVAARMIGIWEVYPLIAGLGSVFLSDTPKARLVRWILTIEYRFALRGCPAVFFQNNDDVSLFRSLGIIRRQSVVLLHGSGVNIDKFHAMPLPERTAFLCVSRLIRDKGVMEYLDACRMLKSEYPDVRCMLVGPFDSNPSAITPEELAPYINDGSVEYFGEQHDVLPYYAMCSVYVLPSYREGTPKTVLEAMACGRAVITTDAPGCRETVEDGVNGRLVPVKDVGALCEKMRELIREPKQAAQMGRQGCRLAEEKYDVRLVNQEICRVMGM